MSKPPARSGFTAYGVYLVLAGSVVAVLVAVLVDSGSVSPSFTLKDREIQLNFGVSRESISRTLRIDLCDLSEEHPDCRPSGTSTGAPEQPTEPAPPAVETPPSAPSGDSDVLSRPDVLAATLTSDLTSSEGSQFPASQVAVSAANVGATSLAITLNADPRAPEDVDSGTYEGTVVVERALGPRVEFAVKATLASRGGWTSIKAILALSVGAISGSIIKWLNDSFGVLWAVRRKQREIEQYLNDYAEGLPRAVWLKLNEVRAALSSYDPDDIGRLTTNLEEIRSDQDMIVKFASAIQALESNLKKKREALDQIPPEQRGRKLASLASDERIISELRRRMWPPGDVKALSDELDRIVDRSERQLEALRRAASGDSSSAKADEELHALAQSVPDSIDKIHEHTMRIEDGAGVPGGEAARRKGLRSRLGSRTGFPRPGARLRILDNAWWLTLLVISTVVVFVGYQTQFMEDPGFEGDANDWIRLIAWALAIQIAGGTVVEAVGKLRTSSTPS